MRVRAAIVTLVAALAAGDSFAASGQSAARSPGTSAASARCGPSTAPTLASSRLARVYSWHGGVFGCSFAAHRSFRLGTTARSLHELRVQPVVVVGTFVAYGLSSFGVDTISATVVLRRLTDGRRIADFGATHVGLVEGAQSVRSLALTGRGAVAWIGVAQSIVGHRQVIEVHAAAAASGTGPGSADRVLDSGPQIAPASLRLHGSTLTWRHGASTRHATLA